MITAFNKLFALTILIGTVSCSGQNDFAFSGKSSTRATKEIVQVGSNQVGADSDGAYDSTDPDNGGDGSWQRDGDAINGGSGIEIEGQVPNGTGNNGGDGILGTIGGILGPLIPDPNLVRCQLASNYSANAVRSGRSCTGSNQVSMYNNLVGGYLTGRWKNLAPGKLVCLDKRSCDGAWDGNGCTRGKLYSYDPANNCERSGSPVGERGLDGCFDPETMIQMSNGSLVAIKNIRSGDKVYNPTTKTVMTVDKMIKGPEAEPLYLVEHKNGRTLVTSKHPFLLKSGQVLMANSLRAGDFVQDAKGDWMTLTKVEKQAVKKGQEVWNFTFRTKSTDPKDHIVVADGVAAGDLWLQREMSKKQVAAK
jgi:hypothetical protein